MKQSHIAQLYSESFIKVPAVFLRVSSDELEAHLLNMDFMCSCEILTNFKRLAGILCFDRACGLVLQRPLVRTLASASVFMQILNEFIQKVKRDV